MTARVQKDTMTADLTEMTDQEAEAHLLSVLREHGRMTTRELEASAQQIGKKCPDGAVKFLMRLKVKGVIKGEVDVDKGGWVWSVGPEG
jgi:hypothetical protein